jgi:hypothetical protein
MPVDTLPVERAFKKMGAPVIVREITNTRRMSLTGVSIDVRTVEGQETFILDVPQNGKDYELSVVDNQPKLRHLLLQVRSPSEMRGQATVEKFLCGHDERHWFVSGVKAINVADAFKSLKPQAVQAHEKAVGVKRAKKNKHHNEAWTRQGEWFFIPAPDFDPVAAKAILVKNEPISRGRGSKPHICEELARVGGNTVYSDGSAILSIAQFTSLQHESPRRASMFQQRTIDAGVYIRGKVRHPDHKTVEFKTWHRVEMNGEIVSGSVKFLD